MEFKQKLEILEPQWVQMTRRRFVNASQFLTAFAGHRQKRASLIFPLLTEGPLRFDGASTLAERDGTEDGRRGDPGKGIANDAQTLLEFQFQI